MNARRHLNVVLSAPFHFAIHHPHPHSSPSPPRATLSFLRFQSSPSPLLARDNSRSRRPVASFSVALFLFRDDDDNKGATPSAVIRQLAS